jgi:hypothetical protein
VTFITTGDEGIFFDLVTYLKANGQPVPRELEEHPAAQVRQQPADFQAPGQSQGQGQPPMPGPGDPQPGEGRRPQQARHEGGQRQAYY